MPLPIPPFAVCHFLLALLLLTLPFSASLRLQSATFTMVARDRFTRKAAQVNRLVPQTDGEKAIFERGAARKLARLVRMCVMGNHAR